MCLTGVDSAPEMIAICESRLPRQTWRVADLRSLSLDEVFNGILAWNSFFRLRFDDQRRMFPVFRAHAAPRAMLIFTSGPAYDEAMATFEGEPLYHARLESAEYRALLGENGFAVVAHAVEDWTCGPPHDLARATIVGRTSPGALEAARSRFSPFPR